MTDAIATLPGIKRFNLNGNMLGEEGINDIKIRMTAANKYEVLGPFDEDELLNEDPDESYDPEKNDSQGLENSI